MTTFYLRFSTIRRPLNDDGELLFYATLYERSAAAIHWAVRSVLAVSSALGVEELLATFAERSHRVSRLAYLVAGYKCCALLQALLLPLQTHLCVTCKIVAKTASEKYLCALLVATVIAVHTNWY